MHRAIPRKELLNKRFMTADAAPHFTAMVQRFNLVRARPLYCNGTRFLDVC
jgi:hypothetical protein